MISVFNNLKGWDSLELFRKLKSTSSCLLSEGLYILFLTQTFIYIYIFVIFMWCDPALWSGVGLWVSLAYASSWRGTRVGTRGMVRILLLCQWPFLPCPTERGTGFTCTILCSICNDCCVLGGAQRNGAWGFGVDRTMCLHWWAMCRPV